MAVPPLRRRAGKVEIDNKERRAREELEARKEAEGGKDESISEEEHNRRLEMLRGIGVLRE